MLALYATDGINDNRIGANEMYLSIVRFSNRYDQLRKNVHVFSVAKGQTDVFAPPPRGRAF